MNFDYEKAKELLKCSSDDEAEKKILKFLGIKGNFAEETVKAGLNDKIAKTSKKTKKLFQDILSCFKEQPVPVIHKTDIPEPEKQEKTETAKKIKDNNFAPHDNGKIKTAEQEKKHEQSSKPDQILHLILTASTIQEAKKNIELLAELCPESSVFEDYCEKISSALLVTGVPVKSIRYFAAAPSRCMAFDADVLWVLILWPSSQIIMSGFHAASSFSKRHADS